VKHKILLIISICFTIAAVNLFGAASSFAGDDPFWSYKRSVLLMEEAQDAEAKDDIDMALTNFLDAEKSLEALKEAYPDWYNIVLVDIALKKCQASIERLKAEGAVIVVKKKRIEKEPDLIQKGAVPEEMKIGKVVSLGPGAKEESVKERLVKGLRDFIIKEKVGMKDWEGYSIDNVTKVSVNGEYVSEPFIMRKDDEVWVSLFEIAEASHSLVYGSRENKFRVSRADGSYIQLELGSDAVIVGRKEKAELPDPVYLYEDRIMVSRESLDDILKLAYSWEPATSTIALEGEAPDIRYTTYTIRKPKVEIPKMPLPPTAPRIARLQPQRMPGNVRPSIDLDNYISGSYRYNYLSKEKERTIGLRSRGKFFDRDLSSSFKWRDEQENTGNTRHLIEDEKYIGLFRKGEQMEFLDLYESMRPLRSQSENFEGVKYSKEYDPYRVKGFWGLTDNTVTGPSSVGAVRYFGNMFGLRNEYYHKYFDTKAMVVTTFSRAENREKSGTTNYPKRNLILFNDTSLHLTDDTTLSAQYAGCNYVPDDYTSKVIHDMNWRTALEVKKRKFQLKSDYEFVGTDYASYSDPSSYQNYKGWGTSGQYRISDWLSLNGSASQYQNNVDDNSDQATRDSTNFGLSSYISMPAAQSLSIRWTWNESETNGPSEEASGSIYNNLSFDYSKTWTDFLTFYGSYDHTIDDPIGSGTSQIKDRYTFTLLKYLRTPLRGSYLRFKQDMERTKYGTSGNFTKKEYDSDLGFRYVFTKNLSVVGTTRISAVQEEATENRASLSGDIGIRQDLSERTYASLTWALGGYNLKNLEDATTKNWTVICSATHRFDVVSGYNWGGVEGIAFHDFNGDGTYSDGEPLLKDVRVDILGQDSRLARTDTNGYFLIEKVAPSTQLLRADALDLPIDMAIAKGYREQKVEIEARQNAYVEFPVIQLGDIEGRFFIDEDDDGVFDEGEEEGVEGAMIIAEPGYTYTHTDENGAFKFENIPPGDLTVRIEVKEIPSYYSFASPESWDVKLMQGSTVKDVSFFLRPKEIELEVFE